MQFDLSMTDELLATTRAVRKRLDLERPVQRDTILECLQLAVQAPNGGNRQLWRWLVIDDTDVKREMGKIYHVAAETYFAESVPKGSHRADEQTSRIFDSWRWLVDNLENVPFLLIPCVERVLDKDASLEKTSSFFGSIFPAIWSFQLALRSRGLGSTITTLHLMESQRSAELLGIPEGITQIAMLPIAYTKGTDFKRATRPPVETITHWNKW